MAERKLKANPKFTKAVEILANTKPVTNKELSKKNSKNKKV